MKRGKLAGVMILLGESIGAGVLGMPYVISQSGFLIGIIELVIVTVLSILISLYVAEAALRTKKTHQIAGLAKKYLGKKKGKTAVIAVLMAAYGATIAYTVAMGNILNLFFGDLIPFFGSEVFLSIASALIIGIFIYFGIDVVKEWEVAIGGLMISLLIFLSSILIFDLEISNLGTIHPENFLLPYGVLLFACFSFPAVPELTKTMKNEEVKEAIIYAGLVYFALYTIFSLAVVGAYGFEVGKIVTETFSGTLGVAANLLALFTMGTSFMILGLVIRDTYIEDFNLSKKTSWGLAIGIPIAVSLLLKPGFTDVLGFTGAVAGGVAGILLGITLLKARKKGDKKPEFTIPGGKYTIIVASILFLLGILAETLKYLNLI